MDLRGWCISAGTNILTCNHQCGCMFCQSLKHVNESACITVYDYELCGHGATHMFHTGCKPYAPAGIENGDASTDELMLFLGIAMLILILAGIAILTYKMFQASRPYRRMHVEDFDNFVASDAISDVGDDRVHATSMDRGQSSDSGAHAVVVE